MAARTPTQPWRSSSASSPVATPPSRLPPPDSSSIRIKSIRDYRDAAIEAIVIYIRDLKSLTIKEAEEIGAKIAVKALLMKPDPILMPNSISGRTALQLRAEARAKAMSSTTNPKEVAAIKAIGGYITKLNESPNATTHIDNDLEVSKVGSSFGKAAFESMSKGKHFSRRLGGKKHTRRNNKKANRTTRRRS